MNYLEHIEFNKSIIELYKNSEGDYKQKIFLLLRENIEFYTLLNRAKRKRVVKTEIPKQTEKRVWMNSKIQSMYKLPYYKESEISEEDIEREVEIGFNLVIH